MQMQRKVERYGERERERDNTEKEINFTPKNLGKIESTTYDGLAFLDKLAKAKPCEEPDRSR